ncbi:hypothetical protein RFI_03936 [Reticulomyxa filosa]|uniref:CHAT domain-containing protein n=1 Tax=Reticulomyxa filosa TaxID=46433 RepID=X6P3P9_RETFI|nr:hypothetical protein RFI_03936 [Reticulomyxa filosa]|eukprot:ETO33170.1 hypothetical protein RFI_03936 [Reticulomyxa filosa]
MHEIEQYLSNANNSMSTDKNKNESTQAKPNVQKQQYKAQQQPQQERQRKQQQQPQEQELELEQEQEQQEKEEIETVEESWNLNDDYEEEYDNADEAGAHKEQSMSHQEEVKKRSASKQNSPFSDKGEAGGVVSPLDQTVDPLKASTGQNSSSSATFESNMREDGDGGRTVKYDLIYLTSSPLVIKTLNGLKPLAQLNIKEECDRLFDTLKSCGLRISVKHVVATAGAMITAFVSGCRVMHYSGHGMPQSLVFENPKNLGFDHSVSCDLIGRACRDAKYGPELVVASACHSEVVGKLFFFFFFFFKKKKGGKAFVEAGIKHVIAVKTEFELNDDAASEFTNHFYHSLLTGNTILDAFKHAKNAVTGMPGVGKQDEKKFVLLPIDPNDRIHNVKLFRPGGLPKGDLIDDSTPLPPNNLPPPVSNFMGRNADMVKLIQPIVDNGVKMVGLMGPEGVGKSALAIMTARYLCHRSAFKGGVFYVDVAKLMPTHPTLESMLIHTMQFSEKYRDIPENEFFGKIHNFDRLLLVFDHIDKFGVKSEEGDLNPSEDEDDTDDSGMESEDEFGHYPTEGGIKGDLAGSGGNNSGSRMSKSHGSHRRIHRRNAKNKRKTEISKKNAQKTKDAIKHFFSAVFDLTRSEIKVLITSTTKRHELSEIRGGMMRYHVLQELSSEDSAKLFARLANQFRWKDILAKQDLMALLANNPAKIHKVAQCKHNFDCNDLDKVIKTYTEKEKILARKFLKTSALERGDKHKTHPKRTGPKRGNDENKRRAQQLQALMNEHITDPNARKLWLGAKGSKTATFKAMFEQLRNSFELVSPSRPLKEEDILEVCQSYMDHKGNLVIETFEKFFRWFDGICDLVTILKDVWVDTNPVRIHGFIGRANAEKKLQVQYSDASSVHKIIMLIFAQIYIQNYTHKQI